MPVARAVPQVLQRLAPAPRLRFAELDDGLAVFEPSSGLTHLLNDAAAAVLEFLFEQPRSEADVVFLLEQLLEEGKRGEAAKHASQVLGDLLQLHLIIPTDK